MTQVILHGPRNIEFNDAPVPIPKGDDVLVRNRYCGICGTDVHHYSGSFALFKDRSLYLGHEVCGVVEAVGEQVTDLSTGDWVTIDPNFSCGYCKACRSGRRNHCHNLRTLGTVGPAGFSDFSLAPRQNVYSFNVDRLSPRDAALTEPLACVLNGVRQLSPSTGGRALVIGAGTMGLLFVQVLRLYGVIDITVSDIKRERLLIADHLGADQSIIAESTTDQGGILPQHQHSFDYVIDCTGKSEVVELSISLLDDGGKLLLFGVCPQDGLIRMSPYELYRRDLHILGSFSLNETMGTALSVLEMGKIETDPLIDSIRTRDRLIETIEWLEKGNGKGRVVMEIGSVDG